jgi:hypothetical protein
MQKGQLGRERMILRTNEKNRYGSGGGNMSARKIMRVPFASMVTTWKSPPRPVVVP